MRMMRTRVRPQPRPRPQPLTQRRGTRDPDTGAARTTMIVRLGCGCRRPARERRPMTIGSATMVAPPRTMGVARWPPPPPPPPPLLLLPLLLLLLPLLSLLGTAARAEEVPGAYMVLLWDGATADEMRELQQQVREVHASAAPPHAHKHGRVTDVELHTVMRAFELVDASDEMVEHLRGVRSVQAVTQQIMYYPIATPGSWGQDRIDQEALPLDNDYTSQFDGSGVDVYVIDTGIDTLHVDFASPDRNVINIYNAFGPVTDDTDGHFHGTHCAGTVGSNTYGVATKTNIYGVKVLSDAGSGSTATVADGVDFAVQYASTTGRPSVISMSLGGACSERLCPGRVTNIAVNAAVDAGIPVAVAAGNDDYSACYYGPASAEKAITVASTTSADSASFFSNYGPCVDIAAPGSNITSTCAFAECGDETSTLTASGTSMAAPHVAGVIAQMLQANPTATPDQVKQSLQCSSSKNQLDYSTADGSAVNYLLQTAPASLQVCDLGAGCPDSCSGNGACDTSGVQPVCICYPQYAGPTCASLFVASSAPTPAPPLCPVGVDSIPITMQDSYGDGWEGAELLFYLNGSEVFSTTMLDGSIESDVFCPPEFGSCYDVLVTKGAHPAEVWWSMADLIAGAGPVHAQLCVGDDGNDTVWQCDLNVVQFAVHEEFPTAASAFAIRNASGYVNVSTQNVEQEISAKFDIIGTLLPPDPFPTGAVRDFCLAEGEYKVWPVDLAGSNLTLSAPSQIFPTNFLSTFSVPAILLPEDDGSSSNDDDDDDDDSDYDDSRGGTGLGAGGVAGIAVGAVVCIGAIILVLGIWRRNSSKRHLYPVRQSDFARMSRLTGYGRASSVEHGTGHSELI